MISNPDAAQVGEIDRARAIYVHAASLSDPRVDEAFWTEWKDFEVAYGNEDTYREMLRIRRSVAASFSQLHFNTAIIDTATGAPSTGASSNRPTCFVTVSPRLIKVLQSEAGTALARERQSLVPGKCPQWHRCLGNATSRPWQLSTRRHPQTRVVAGHSLLSRPSSGWLVVTMLTTGYHCSGTVEAGMGKRKRGGDDMEALEATLEEGTRLPGFVSAGVIQSEQPPGTAADGGLAAAGTDDSQAGGAAAAANPEDIDLDEADEEETEGGHGGEPEDGVSIEQKDVPNSVFGSIGGSAQLGALDRFKKRRTDDADT